MVDEKVAIDTITFQVLKNAFSSIVDEMAALVQKCAFSLVVSEGRDYCGTITNKHGDLIATGVTDLPAHLGTIPFTIKGMIEWLDVPVDEYFSPGDIVIINDAYIGGTHNNDIRLVMPVYYEGSIVGFVIDSAHWADIGGHVPGTFDPNARSSHGEGLIIPPIKIVEEGKLNEDLSNMILRNVRMQSEAYGDLMAQIGAVRLGSSRLVELIDRYGLDLIESEMDALISYSKTILKKEFEKLPDGKYEFTALIDKDPAADTDDPLEVTMELIIEGDKATYDFSRSSPVAKGAINSTKAVTVSGAVIATKSIFPWVPINQGVFHAIDIILPDNLVCNALYPNPVCGAAATIYPAVTDCIHGTFIQIIPERCCAGTTGLVNTTWGGLDTRDPSETKEFVAYIWLEGGWGARPGKKDNHSAMCLFASTATNIPIEQVERMNPIIFESYRYEPDSMGAGYHRGGPGVVKSWYFSHGEAIGSSLGDGEVFGPWGYEGGKGAPGSTLILAKDTSEEEALGMFLTGAEIGKDKTVEFFMSGGGGWGNPYERPVDWVCEDVENGLVSVDAAKSEYGVVLKETEIYGEYLVDEEETDSLRKNSK
jgi:N-methylhydantoinase B